jgi:hypothetical protein
MGKMLEVFAYFLTQFPRRAVIQAGVLFNSIPAAVVVESGDFDD